MVSTAFFQFILLAIDNDCRDLLIQEDENDTEHGRKECDKPPIKLIRKRIDDPAACA